MNETNVKAVILPNYEGYLRALVDRRDRLTTLVWGWRGLGGLPKRVASPMATPRRILDAEQKWVPFLYRPTDQEPKAVTHAAVSGGICHRHELDDLPGAREWLYQLRVEQFTLPRGDEWFALSVEEASAAASTYVVTAGLELEQPIAQGRLRRVKTGESLSPNMARGYAIVWLPAELEPWYAEACRRWDDLAEEVPPTLTAAVRVPVRPDLNSSEDTQARRRRLRRPVAITDGQGQRQIVWR